MGPKHPYILFCAFDELDLNWAPVDEMNVRKWIFWRNIRFDRIPELSSQSANDPKAAIPAKAGIQSISGYFFDHSWTPAFAGVTT